MTDTPTDRELQIITLLSDGLDLADIGRVLFISRHTVRTHLTGLFDRTGTRRQAHLVAHAFRQGWIR